MRKALAMLFVVGCVMYAAIASPSSGRIGVYGFDDYCGDGMCHDNPAGRLAQSLGGQVVPVEWGAVEKLVFDGASLGLGLDSLTEHAYTNGMAGGLSSLAVEGPDAGTWECGHLYSRMLEVDRCSAFVHLPLVLSPEDVAMVRETIARVRRCQLEAARRKQNGTMATSGKEAVSMGD